MEEGRRERGTKERRVSPDNHVKGTGGQLEKRGEWGVGIESFRSLPEFRDRI